MVLNLGDMVKTKTKWQNQPDVISIRLRTAIMKPWVWHFVQRNLVFFKPEVTIVGGTGGRDIESLSTARPPAPSTHWPVLAVNHMVSSP